MNQFTKWKFRAVAAVLLLGLLLALPNIFGKSPAVQMQFADRAAAESAIGSLDWAGLNLPKPSRVQYHDRGQVNIFYPNTDQQIQAKDYLAKRFSEAKATVNLISNGPGWLESIGLKPMNLGLDLRGGISFLLQVDSKELFKRKSSELTDQVNEALKKEQVESSAISAIDRGGVAIFFKDDATRSRGEEALRKNNVARGLEQRNSDGDGKYALELRYTEKDIVEMQRKTAEQNRIRMSGRVNSLGVAEPSIQVVGNDRILVQLPGIQDVAQAKELLGSTATLEFYMVDEDGDVAEAVKLGRGKLGQKLSYFEDGRPILLKSKMLLSGEHIIDASSGLGRTGPEVSVKLDSAGGSQMSQITHANVGKQMATLYVEYIPVTKIDANGQESTSVEKKEMVANAATIQGVFGSDFQITGINPMERADKLAATLRAGSLVAPVYIIEERTIGPSAGQQNIDQGINASLLGLLLVAGFMWVYYGRLGLYANIALAFNLVLLIALMSLIGATLTLPGIAGIVLTMGMAVDANVLIYERIREEKEQGLGARECVSLGFGNAMATIVDANITTLIVALMLFSFGAGPIKGFAVTLTLGILTTMFSAIYVTRGLVEWFELRRPNPEIKL